MDAIFLHVLNMSLTASYVILVVLIVRLLLKKAPKIFSYALWSAVLFRLICPFSFESFFSLTSMNVNPIPDNIMYVEIPQISTGINLIDSIVNPVLATQKAAPYASINPMQISILLGEFVWVFGVSILLVYSILSLARLRNKLIGAVKWHDNIYLVDYIATPFVMDIVQPRIYLPSTLSEREQKYIILHEQTHIRHFDHIVKIIGFFVLSVHWFNPLVWLAFVLCMKDMEMSCDEIVMKHLDTDIRCEYSASLLSLATGRKIVAGIPLAFGEGDTKSRVKNVLKYKKPTFGVVIAAAIVVVGVCFGLIINPMPSTMDNEVNLSDIEQMNIGTEMPRLLYGNDSLAIMHGTFGLLVYNLNDSMVTGRISYDQLRALGISWAYAGVSQDGKTIYIGNHDKNSELRFTHQYDIKSNTIKEFSQQDVDVFKPIQISPAPGYSEQYDKYFDFHYLINDTIVEIDNSFMYLRADTDWSMKSLQLVICQYADGSSKILNVFKY